MLRCGSTDVGILCGTLGGKLEVSQMLGPQAALKMGFAIPLFGTYFRDLVVFVT